MQFLSAPWIIVVKDTPLTRYVCRHGKINHYLANNFIDELVFELKIAKNVKNTNWSPKLIFSMKKKIRKIPVILDRFNIKQITHQILLTPWKTYHQLCVWNLHGKLTRSWSGCAFTRVGHSLLYVIRVCQILPCGHYFGTFLGTFLGKIFGNNLWENFWEHSLGVFFEPILCGHFGKEHFEIGNTVCFLYSIQWPR